MNQGLTITLAEEVNALVVPAIYKNITEVIIDRMVDEPAQKRVVAFTANGLGAITLWEGAAYDTIGQWTDTDVANRIREIYQ